MIADCIRIDAPLVGKVPYVVDVNHTAILIPHTFQSDMYISSSNKIQIKNPYIFDSCSEHAQCTNVLSVCNLTFCNNINTYSTRLYGIHLSRYDI